MAKKQKPKKSEKAFNVFYPFYLSGFIITSWGNAYLIFKEYTFSWILVFLWLILLAVLCVDSVYYEFTKDEIYFVKIFGRKKRIPWFYVTNIIKHDFWSSVDDRWTYEVYYKVLRKGKEHRVSVHLPATPKISKCLYKYYSHTIVGTKKRKRK